jgi:hypothetical protein
MSSSSTSPLKLVTVNTAPDRARRLIGRVVESVKDRYTIVHADNVESESPLRSPIARCAHCAS